MRTRWNQNRASFTLVELMVVVVILGILASLITAAAMAALVATREATMKFEVDSLAQALHSYKTEFGEFPPDFTDVNLVEAHARNRWPRIATADLNAIKALATGSPSLTRAQALVFWLRGFSGSPTHPHTSSFPTPPATTGPPRLALFDFDKSRLIDLSTGTTWLSTATTIPVYIPANSGRNGAGEVRPYVYFDARTYATSTYGYFNESAQARTLRPYRTDNPTIDVYAAVESYQLICAGLDADYGPLSTTAYSPTYPTGTNYTAADRDNIVNFVKVGRTLDDSVP